MITDHKTIEVYIKVDKNEKNNKEKTKIISWKNYNTANLLAKLAECDWSSWHNADINDRSRIVNNNLLYAVKSITNEINVKSEIRPRKWFDYELYNMKKDKIEAYNKWLMNGKKDEHWKIYVNIRNNYIRIMKVKKSDFEKENIRKAGLNQTEMWKVLNKMIGKNKNNMCDEIIFDNEHVKDREKIAKKFNHFICE